MALGRYRVEQDGQEPYEVDVLSRDALMWERTTKGANFGRYQQNPSLTDTYRVVYQAARRIGRFTGTAEEFAELADIEPVAAEPVDPTSPAP